MRTIDREILSLAIPSIITNITTPLLALMDVVIVGHMGSASYIAAIAVGGTMFNMIYWLFGFLRMGTSGLAAQAHGASDRNEETVVLCRGLMVALAAAVMILVLSGILCRVVVRFMDVESDVAPLVRQYFMILVWGAPAVLATYTFCGWFLGMGDARTPMWVSLLINTVNIAVSVILVLSLHYRITGIAVGTLTAQWTGALCCVMMAVRKYGVRPVQVARLVDITALRRFFSINADIFLRTLCLIAVTVWFTRVGAQQGTLLLAVNTLLMQFFMFFSYFMDGFAYAGESVCGNCAGAGDYQKLHNAVKALFRWGIWVASAFTLVYCGFGTVIMNLLSDDPSVLGASHDYAFWVWFIPLTGFASFTWDGIYIGTTRTREMLLSMAIATGVYFIIYVILYPVLANHGLWIAFISYLVVRGLILTVCSKRLFR